MRFEVTANSLAPQLGVVAPLREWELLTREDEVDYAIERGIDIPITREKPYSIDHNLWGCAIECGEMEDLWTEPPSDAWVMTKDPSYAPPERSDHPWLRVRHPGQHRWRTPRWRHPDRTAERTGGHYGVDRIDMVENRVVGLKSRGGAPGAVPIHMAHRELERICLDRPTFNYKQKVSQDFANIIYDGKWFGPLREALQAFVDHTDRPLTGEVRIRVSAGTARITGRRSPFSLYDEGLATYSHGDTFDRTSAEGFLKLYGLSYATVAKVQRQTGG